MRRYAPAYVVLLFLAACGDPLGGIDRVSDGAVLPETPGANALPTQAELDRENPVLTDLLQDVSDVDPAAAPPVTPESVEITADTPNDVVTRRGSVAPEASGGVFGWLRQAARSTATEEGKPVAVALTRSDSEAAAPEDNRSTGADRRRFGRASVGRTRAGPDAADVTPGTVVPFGEIARNCAAKPAADGTIVDKAARKGRGYTLYDTAPDSGVPRTFYVTGFSDNCPRQFTAALALFGDPAFHEQLRYGLPAEEYPYSSTDKAYEKLKRRICNVGRDMPCGDRITRLERSTTFISAYENFTDNARWVDMLLHDGVVLATALKTP